MTRTDIINRARPIVSVQLDVEPEAITLDASFVDLGADSLDAIYLNFDLEREFGVDISDDDAETIRTLGQAVDFLCAKLGVGEAV